MPEGDTVYRLARRLEAALDGRTLTRAELRVPSLATRDLRGATVREHDTHGKHLLTRLSDGRSLHTHLRMTGSWTVARPGNRLPRRLLPDTRVLLETDEARTAYGLLLPVVQLVRTEHERDVIGHLGPDPLRDDWDAADAAARLTKVPRRPAADALLDQRCVAGLGNLWVNEICFLRGVDPWSPIGSVDVDRLLQLARRALRQSATQPRSYQVTTGDPRRGNEHWVAGRAHLPCRRCHTTIRVADVGPGGRRTWWCPSCQPPVG